MDHVVTKSEALLVLPVLQGHAASLLDQTGHRAARELADLLRAGEAGGNAVEGLNQNFEHDHIPTWPSELDTFWRVLCAYEEIALGGHLQRGGLVTSLRRSPPEQPNPWMMHEAARVLRRHLASLQPLVEAYEAVAIPPYRKI